MARYPGIAVLLCLLAIPASSVNLPIRLASVRPALAAGGGRVYVVGTRGARHNAAATDDKLDAALADLTRHSAWVHPAQVLADLHSLSPALRFRQSAADQSPLVLIDATTRGDPLQLRSALTSLGLQQASIYSNDVGGWLPLTQLHNAAAHSQVVALRAAMPRARSGAVTSQGDYAQRSALLRTANPAINATGITVGVLSDSFNCYAIYAEPNSGVPFSGNEGYAYNGFSADFATDVSTGDLPSTVQVLEEANCLDYGAPTRLPFGDEGRAMLQVVHDVAPGAGLAFHTAENSEADFAAGIGKLATAGSQVIADDVGYFDEPFFQDGLIAQAVDAAAAQGVAYFSAAGNNGTLAYENTAPSFATLAAAGKNPGEYLLNFDASGATNTTSLPVTIPPLLPGDFVAIVVEWDQPYVTGAAASPGASSRIDVCVTGGTNADVITDYDGDSVSCSGANAIGADPYQIMIIGNPANSAGNSAQQNLNITVGLADGTAAPGRVIVAVEDDGAGSTIDAFATHSPTLQGHSGAAGAAAVGAAFYFTTPQCGTSPAMLESFSSQGGAPILFDTSGNRLASPVIRQKPDFVGPDGGNNTFLGFALASGGITGSDGLLSTNIAECQNDPGYPNFFGTSAATPHAAAVAALLRQSNPALAPAAIYTALRNSASPMAGATPNFASGYGFLQADAALALLVPGAPALTLAATSLASGGATTISWSSLNAASCAATGDWSGTLATSGSQTLPPAASGATSYSLTCANSAGSSATTTVSLTTQPAAAAAAPTKSGGGGNLDAAALLGLLLMSLMRLAHPTSVARARRQRPPTHRGGKIARIFADRAL